MTIRYHLLVRKNHILQSPEFAALNNLVDRVLSVPRGEMQRRLEEYRKQSELNPKRRGPKRKGVTSPSSPDSAVSC